MKVYALVGKSGTGKSYHALRVCRQRKIESLIDDGLFIAEGTVLAGISAKRQKTRVGAIKTAIFTDEEHRRTVVDKIRQEQPGSILILGTSDEMVEQIRLRLALPEFTQIIRIEDVTTDTDREIAIRQRREQGKHVIPAPTFQIKREFSGYFLDPLRIFKGRGQKESYGDRSVVRPTYSYMGDYTISEFAMSDIAGRAAMEFPETAEVFRVIIDNGKSGIRIHMMVFLQYGCRVMETARQIQKTVAARMEYMTAFNIDAVNVEVRGLK